MVERHSQRVKGTREQQYLIGKYSTGHVDTIETAVLRAVRTGVSQASGNMAIEGMNEREWDLIRVSAHLGARYGDGGENPGNHFWWQGKLYSRTGKTPGYPLFEECTGFGTGEGLCDWNCRHSFDPGDPDHNPFQDYDAEENKKAYELSQKQRAMERAIRRSKTELLGYRTAIENCTDPEEKAALQQEYDATALRLKRQNAAYDQFCKENNLQRYDDRLRVAKWNRSEAAKAVSAARTEEKKNILGGESKEALTTAVTGDTMKAETPSGALDPTDKRAEKHADLYYESVRHMTTDVKRIAQNTGYSEEEIQEIKNFVFVEKHDLGGSEPEYFASSYDMAESWQRLIDGKNIQPHDLTLIKHELMESGLMRQGYTQDEAHITTSRVYNYDKEAREYNGLNKKHRGQGTNH